ncbi:MAG TPA: hypothetical protein ENJ82_06900, partial [Bacteroidetes bacterium]|nr:hypothetical protein [Bacteroidota bacterium]
MKYLQIVIFFALIGVFPCLYGQTVIAGGAASGSVTLIPFTPGVCFSNGSTSAVACGSPVTFNFTSFQISSCPSSGKMPVPGSVLYGGPGSSASFTFYHTLSYSPSNEHQQLVFTVPINVFQFSTSGPASGIGEVFRVQTYNGATLNGTHTFNTPGPGMNRTYTISGANFTRVQFTEINAISADDELFGDFFAAGPGCPLPINSLAVTADVVAPNRVRVNWETFEEVQMAHFAVERSLDGKTWQSLKERQAV